MGDQLVDKSSRPNDHHYLRHLINDIRALEIMLDKGVFESGKYRIGAEQEFCIVTDNWRPSTRADEVLAAVDDPHFTTELARYNLEINLDPFELNATAFDKMEAQLRDLLGKARTKAQSIDSEVVLTGILPSISKNEIEPQYMTPMDRYWALNDSIRRLRGADFHLHLSGVDELSINHDTILFEACNTSFQLHLQISPGDFTRSYNWAQAITGPLLSMCTNSPLLLGRELWSETRIALFRQSIDTRRSSKALKESQGRVSFGDRWEDGTIADIYKDTIAQHKTILTREIESNSLEELEAGRLPKLNALALHNGTIYRWNRPCFGVHGHSAHLRIENRYIPSGPSIGDEMANFALWVGLMVGRPERYNDMPNAMDFRSAKSNFIKAARSGRESMLEWDGELLSARRVVEEHLLPIAESGLRKVGVSDESIKKQLGVIEGRLKGKTGAQWLIGNYRRLRKEKKQDEALLLLTKAINENQWQDRCVHEWPDISPEEQSLDHAHLLGHIMTTRVITVRETDPADMAIHLMLWKDIHHVPVENEKGMLCGILTWRHVVNYLDTPAPDENSLVSDIMQPKVITAERSTPIQEAIETMRSADIGCLPILRGDHLVGIVTVHDIRSFAK